LTAAFLASGAASLIFEMVWFYRSSLVLGNSVWAASIVLSSFMAGLGLGNFLAGALGQRMRSPLRAYAFLELLVAASGVAVTYALPSLTGLVVRLAPLTGASPWRLACARLAIAFATLLIPTTAMGATLPVLIGAVSRTGAGLGRVFGRLYGWNAIGAVGGVVSAEVILVNAVGIAGAATAAAFLDLIAAGIALLVLRRAPGIEDRADPAAQSAGAPSRTAWRLLACAVLAGATFMALEVIWFRFLSMFVLTTTLPMSLMLAVVLAGIGAGGLAACRSVGRRGSPQLGVTVAAFLAACLVVASYRLFDLLTTGSQIAEWWRVLWLALVLTGPTAFMSGVLLTALAEALNRETAGASRAAAWLLLANTAGAMGGPLVAAFLLLPALGMERALFALSGIYAVAGLVALLPSSPSRRASPAPARSWGVRLSAAAPVAALVTFPFGVMDRFHERVVRPYAADGSEIIAAREGPGESILLMRQRWLNQPVYDRLVTNGFSMSGTAASAQRYMRYFAYWPMMLHAQPMRRALLICYGVGVTAGALTDISSLDSIDVVEISPDVIAVSEQVYSANRHPLKDRRIRVHLEDGRYFLQTSNERYDVITGEPPPPRTPGAVNIYTREYFQLVYDRLTEGGIVTYWLPVARPDPGTDVNAIIRSFCDVFADCSLWNATPFDFMLVGTRHARGPVAELNVTGAWRTARLASRLREIGFEAPEQIGATFLGDAAYLRQLAGTAPPLTDDFPQRLRPVAGRPSLSDPRYRVDAAVLQMYQRVLDPARAREAFAGSALIRELWPADLIEHTLPFFETQRIVNRILWEGARPLQQIEDLHFLLTRTTLVTLPLWLLGSDDVIQRIAEGAGETNGAAAYTRGLYALARRDYPDAISRFAQADSLGIRPPPLRPLLTYTLCLNAKIDAARDLARGIEPANPDEQHFWSWMASEFRVGPLSKEH
jgi:predicted membrane-bound spermidine synthase